MKLSNPRSLLSPVFGLLLGASLARPVVAQTPATSQPAPSAPAVATPPVAHPEVTASGTAVPPTDDSTPTPSKSVESVLTPSAKPKVVYRVPASGGVPRLELGVTEEALWAVVCRGRCDWTAAKNLTLPARLVAGFTVESVTPLNLGGGRRAAKIDLPAGERRWVAVVAAPTEGNVPVVAHADFVGYRPGPVGQRTGTEVQVFDKQRREVDVVVGTLDEAAQLCGRPALLQPKVLYASEMKLRGIRFQRLSQAERDAAPRLNAVRNPDPVEYPVLEARFASTSGSESGAATDGDVATAWSERRGGNGSGEFLVASSPPGLALSQIHFRLRPSGDVAPEATGPASVWLAVVGQLYHVSLPPDSWAAVAGTVFSVTLPKPVTTDCVALVLDAAQAEGPVDVTIAELSARADITEAEVAQAAAALDSNDQNAAEAARLLSLLGNVGYKAVDRAFAKLSDVGKLRALALLDGAPCSLSARAFALAIDGRGGPLEEHGERSLRRCAPGITSRLVELFGKADGPRLAVIGELLVSLAPERLVDAAVPRLADSGRGRRRILRAILAAALDAPLGHAAAARWLVSPELAVKSRIDLLRAMGERIAQFQPQAGQAVRRLLGGDPDFRTRYLLLAPVAHLSSVDPKSKAVLVRVITGDPDPAVRAEAARLAANASPVIDALTRAASDDAVRVRQAALTSLGEQKAQAAAGVIALRVEKDRWPLVRAAGVRALREMNPTPQILTALAETVELDVSPDVRRPAVLSLGLMGGRGHIDVVRTAFREDPDPYVQAAAAAALGQLCDRSMLDELTTSARVLSRLGASEHAAIVGRASLAALGRLKPADLEQRLRAFESPETPVLARNAARLTLEHPEPCRR